MNKKGFTLIELIMVIAILGILSAYAVPKFFALTDSANDASLEQMTVEIRSGLRMYGLKKLADNGTKSYPLGSTTVLDSIMDENSSELIWSPTSPDSSFIYANGSFSKTMSYSTFAGGTDFILGPWQ